MRRCLGAEAAPTRRAPRSDRPPNRIDPRRALAALLLVALVAGVAAAEPGAVEEVQILGLNRMTREAFLHAFGVRPGDAYDEELIRERFKALWKLGLFEDISIESEQAPGGGRAIIVKVRERPVLTSVTYEDNPVVTRTAIEDRLKEREIPLDLGKPLDMGRVFFVESAIRDLLNEKGHLDAEVKADVRKVTETTRAVHYAIIPGGKTRIRKIEFTGNEILSDRKLRSQLKLTEERRWYWPWSAKNLYHPAKWDQDVGAVRDAYLNRGYLDVEIRPPIMTVVKAKGGKERPEAPAAEPPPATPTATAATGADRSELTPRERKRADKARRKAEKRFRKAEQKKKKVKRWVHLSVPVVEGEQYRLGEITFTGQQVFDERVLRAMIPLAPGQILQNDRLEAGVERISLLYEDRGHLYASAVRRIQRREGERVADVTITIQEDKPYYVGQIEFLGNSSTRDPVLRREMLLTEGQLFSRTRLDLSKTKVNQLGYFSVPEEPIVEPIEGENRVRITFRGEESGRNEIQVGGGYSGLDGAFFNGVYSTRNFLGRGQVVSVALQVGGRSDRYQLSFQEPWFLNRPYQFGASVYRRDVDYGNSLQSTSNGFGLSLGRRIGRFSSVGAGYNWQNVTQRTILSSAISTPDGAQVLVSDSSVSSLTPVFSFSTVNNPYRPSRGRAISLALEIAGGPFGGDVAFLKPTATFTQYRRAFGRSFIGLHLQAGLVASWADGSTVGGSNINEIPRYQRFWLGGDTLGPRVFETRTITPLRYVEVRDNAIVNVIGDPRFQSVGDLVTSGGFPAVIEVGGDRFYLMQSEYVVPLNEQVEVAAFLDAGNTLFEDQGWFADTFRVSAGVEVRFHLPIFPVPLRLIYGFPIREVQGDRTSSFTFSIGRSF